MRSVIGGVLEFGHEAGDDGLKGLGLVHSHLLRKSLRAMFHDVDAEHAERERLLHHLGIDDDDIAFADQDACRFIELRFVDTKVVQVKMLAWHQLAPSLTKSAGSGLAGVSSCHRIEAMSHLPSIFTSWRLLIPRSWKLPLAVRPS